MASPKIGWRLLPVSSATTSPVLTLTFASAAEAQAAVLTPLKFKFGAGAAFMYDVDDDSGDAYTLHQFCQGLTYSDGAGGTVPYKITPAIMGHDGQGNEISTLAGKLSWDQMVTMILAGEDVANHSDIHTDDGAAAQFALMQALANTRFTSRGLTGPAAVVRAGIVPTNYDDYITAYVAAGFPRGTISSASASDGYPQLPQYTSEATFSYSQVQPGMFIMRRSLFDAGNVSLATAQTIIDDLVTGTSDNPKVWRAFSHSDVAGLVRPVIQYVYQHANNNVWMPSLREFGEYLETMAATIVTKVVVGATATWTLNQSALAAIVRWRDMSFRVAGGTPTGATLTGAKGYTRNGTLLNIYNSDVTPVGITAAAVATTPTTTPTATTPTAGPKVDLPYDYTLASATSNQDAGGYATLFDYTTTKPAPNFGYNWLHAGSVMRFPFRPQTKTRLDEIAWVDGAGDAASNSYSPIAIWYKAVGSAPVLLTSFTGASYDENAYQPAIAVPAGGIAEWVELRFVENNAVFMNRLRFRGAQTAYTPPQYNAVTEQLVFASGVNSDNYDYVQSNASLAGYGAIDTTKLAQMRRFGRRNRIYFNVNSMLRPNQYVPQATGPIERRIQAEFHGFLVDDVLGQLHAAGDTPSVSIINTRARTAATWPGYIDQYPYKAAYTDAQGVVQKEVPARPWDNDTNTCVPRAYGTDPLDPASYIEAAKDLAELQLRLGNGTTTDPTKSTFATTKLNTYDTAAPVIKLNLGYVKGFGWQNELNESYLGIQQYMRPGDLAMANSAAFDGHKNTLGAGVGLRAYDPNAELTNMPTSYPAPHYFMGFVEQARATRGLLPSGYVDLPITADDVHYYPTEKTTNQNGVPYQVSPGRPDMQLRRQLAYEFGGPGLKCRWSESGYINDSTAVDGATLLPGRSYVPPSASYTSDQRIAHWNVQNILTGIADGFEVVQLYAANDIAAHGIGAAWDKVGRLKDTPTEFHLGQVNPLLDGYYFAGWVQNGAGTLGQATVQLWKKAGQPYIYAVWMPGQVEATGPVTITLAAASQLTKCVPQDTGSTLVGSTYASALSFTDVATEIPTYYYVGVPSSQLVIPNADIYTDTYN